MSENLSLTMWVQQLITKGYIKKQEKKIIVYLVSQGKSREEILDICLSR